MSKFIFHSMKTDGMFLIEPTVFGDNRGYFMETYNYEDFKDNGLDVTFVQDNQSRSRKGVLRGLHFQTRRPQGKLVRVTSGKVFDVGVDIRPNSKTFGKWDGAILSDENKCQLYIPEGFAHGFLVLSDIAEFVYKCTDLYDPGYEGGIRWDDSNIGIDWPTEEGVEILLSDKDKIQPTFKYFVSKFKIK